MLERMVARLGHEPVLVRVVAPEQLQSADVLVVEPAAPTGVVLAQAARIINPSLPLICASVTAPPSELAELGVLFAAALIKPFTTEQLGVAIEEALPAQSPRRGEGAAGARRDRAA